MCYEVSISTYLKLMDIRNGRWRIPAEAWLRLYDRDRNGKPRLMDGFYINNPQMQFDFSDNDEVVRAYIMYADVQISTLMDFARIFQLHLSSPDSFFRLHVSAVDDMERTAVLLADEMFPSVFGKSSGGRCKAGQKFIIRPHGYGYTEKGRIFED